MRHTAVWEKLLPNLDVRLGAPSRNERTRPLVNGNLFFPVLESVVVMDADLGYYGSFKKLIVLGPRNVRIILCMEQGEPQTAFGQPYNIGDPG